MLSGTGRGEAPVEVISAVELRRTVTVRVSAAHIGGGSLAYCPLELALRELGYGCVVSTGGALLWLGERCEVYRVSRALARFRDRWAERYRQPRRRPPRLAPAGFRLVRE